MLKLAGTRAHDHKHTQELLRGADKGIQLLHGHTRHSTRAQIEYEES